MHDGLTLISTIAAAFGLALVLGFLAVRIGLPALVGYLVAGVFIGPHSPGRPTSRGPGSWSSRCRRRCMSVP